MKCEIHDTDMEWVETGVQDDWFIPDGYWYCEQCQEEGRYSEAVMP